MLKWKDAVPNAVDSVMVSRSHGSSQGNCCSMATATVTLWRVMDNFTKFIEAKQEATSIARALVENRDC